MAVADDRELAWTSPLMSGRVRPRMRPGKMIGMGPVLRICGRLGAGSDDRTEAMATMLGGTSPVIGDRYGVLEGAGPCRKWLDETAASWSPSPLPDNLPVSASENAQRYDCASMVVTDDGTALLQTGISGAAPLFADLGGGPVHVCSRVEPLARTRGTPLEPDWDAWAQILAAGGPLEGRTTFSGIRRLQPWSRLTVDASGNTLLSSSGWPWLEVRPATGARADAVREALIAAVDRHAAQASLVSLLSGGWDSRILAVAAKRATDDIVAWTTSSDTGHALEQLVASQVAETLAIDHKIAASRWDEFGADFEYFVESVDYLTSFHVWAVPLARAVAAGGGTVLDGLGGGIFVGGAFPDTASSGRVEHRFERLTHYLGAADNVLDRRVTAQVRDRTRAGFAAVAAPLADHPFGATFTAYLTRTLPGISLSPFGLFGRTNPVATPFLDDGVVQASLAIPDADHADGRLYPALLRPLEPHLADLPTAADLSPRHRRHGRRISSIEAATYLRELLLTEPIRGLLSPELVAADLDGWATLLDRTKSQHLIRGLATMALWWRRCADLAGESSPDILREPVG